MINKYSRNLFLVFLILLVCNQCMSPENPKNNDKDLPTTENQEVAIPTGNGEAKTVGNVGKENPGTATRVKSDFAIHIPKEINGETKAPVIFIFDPHANGDIPISKYRNLADEFGFVLVGSNKSRNGQAIEDGLKYFNEMKTGIYGKVNVDSSRIFTMGFSGGARVAVSIAIQEPGVNAVIGCGAGFPAIRQLPKPNFYYFAMVGYKDFNMVELINNDRLLTRSGFENELAIFDGEHDWPPEDEMREAFYAILMNDMKKGIIKKDQNNIADAVNYYDSKIENYINADRYFDAAETAERAASIMQGIYNKENFKSEVQTFKKNPAYGRDLSAMVKTMETENGKQNNYMTAFNDKDMDWWNNEIKTLKTPVDGLFQERLNKRLISYLGLMSYMMSNKAIQENDMVQAQKNIDIYRSIEPVNPEHFYLNAIIKMNIGDEAAAESYLQQSIVLGFNNSERFLNEPAFKNLKNKKVLLDLMK